VACKPRRKNEPHLKKLERCDRSRPQLGCIAFGHAESNRQPVAVLYCALYRESGVSDAEEESRAGRRGKKSRRIGRKKKPAEARAPTDLSDPEKDLLSHMEQGWQLETDSLGGNPVLRDPKGGEIVRPPSANRGTVEALEKRGLIVRGKTGDPLKILWRMNQKSRD